MYQYDDDDDDDDDDQYLHAASATRCDHRDSTGGGVSSARHRLRLRVLHACIRKHDEEISPEIGVKSSTVG